MRLTHVARLRLPFGRLWTYELKAGPAGRELPISFDQCRHVEAGDRPGSWMALSFELRRPVDRDRLAAAWLSVIARHGTLRTAFTPGADTPELHEIEVEPGAWAEYQIKPGQAVNDALREVLDDACRPFNSPSYRLCFLQTATEPHLVIASDHAHVDMWSMLVLVRDLLSALSAVESGGVPSVHQAPAFSDHTRMLADRPGVPDAVRHRWAEILEASGDVMPRFPMPLGRLDVDDRGAPGLPMERVEVRDVLDVDDSAAFAAQAADDGVSTLALVVAAMTAVTMDLAGTALRAVFPVHSRYDHTWHDSVGWFITNSVIESPDPDPKASSAAVKEAISLGSWPLADVLAPWGGMPQAPGMFAISWLDMRRLPVKVDSVGLNAQYVSAALPTDGVMLWFILDRSGLHLRCRYPDTPESRTSVGRWLDALVHRLRADARESVGGRLRLDGRVFRVRRAERADVAALGALMNESSPLVELEDAYDAIDRDPAHYLAAVTDESAKVVGTMQLTIIPGMSHHGATRLQIAGVRVARGERGSGLGSAMLEWAHDHGRARGATLAQVIVDDAQPRDRSFLARLGYHAGPLGLELDL